MNLLVMYSKTSDSSYDISLQETRVANIARHLVPCGLIQGAVESCYRRHVLVTKVICRFLGALRLVEKLNNETGSEQSRFTKGALGVFRLDKSVLSRADVLDVVLYIEAATAHT